MGSHCTVHVLQQGQRACENDGVYGFSHLWRESNEEHVCVTAFIYIVSTTSRPRPIDGGNVLVGGCRA